MQRDHEDDAVAAGGIMIVAGAWLGASLVLFNISAEAFVGQAIMAAILIALGFGVAYSRNAYLIWLAVIAGAWLIVTPLIFELTTDTRLNQLFVGLVIVSAALWGRRSLGHSMPLQH